MKKNYLSLRGGKTLHLEYDNGRDDNNSSAFTLLYSCLLYTSDAADEL